MTLKHSHQTVIADDPAYDVGSDEWNGDHVVSGTSGQFQYNSSGSLTGAANLTYNGGNLQVGGFAAQQVGGKDVKFEIFGSGITSYPFGFIGYGTTANAAFALCRTKGSTPTDFTAISSGGQIASLDFYGSDGTQLTFAGSLIFYAVGTISNGIVPGQFEVDTADSAGVSRQRAIWDHKGNTIIGATGPLATNATDGFIYIQACDGPPTGTPSSFTGRVPLFYDRTNNKLYVYNGGWKGVTLA